MAANFEDLKKSLKNRFWSESIFFSRNVIAWCVDLDEKIVIKAIFEHSATLYASKERRLQEQSKTTHKKIQSANL